MTGLGRVIAATFLVASSGAAFAADPPVGAASCSGSHPTARFVSTPVPRLVGRTAAEIVAAMTAFKSGQQSATVMDRIAKGYSEDEIKAIAAWYATLKD